MYLRGRSLISIGVEAGFDLLNQRYSEFTQPNCLLPGGGIGNCHFTTRVRDRALSVSFMARLQARAGVARPYLLLGLGVLDVRTHDRTDVTDDSGNRLENFSHDGTTGDGAGLGHIGAGVAWFPGSGPLALTIEGRATAVLHNYSGGPQLNWSPGILAGVRWGGR